MPACLTICASHGQAEEEAGTITWAPLGPARATVALDDAPNDRQSDPTALDLRTVQPLKGLKDLPGLLGPEARPVVADLDLDRAVRLS